MAPVTEYIKTDFAEINNNEQFFAFAKNKRRQLHQSTNTQYLVTTIYAIREQYPNTTNYAQGIIAALTSQPISQYYIGFSGIYMEINPLFTYSNTINIYVVRPFIEGKSLTDIIRQRTVHTPTGRPIADIIASNIGLLEGAIARIAMQALQGLAEIHGQNRVHGNILPSNLFITSTYSIRLVDAYCTDFFQENRYSPNSPKGKTHDEAYHNKEEKTPANDIYRLGLALLEGFLGVRVDTIPSTSVTIAINNNKFAPYIEMRQHTPEWQNFLLQMLNDDPSQIPTAQQLLAHPFLQSAANVSDDAFAEELAFDTINLPGMISGNGQSAFGPTNRPLLPGSRISLTQSTGSIHENAPPPKKKGHCVLL
jgi:serine/threonine protein kinase